MRLAAISIKYQPESLRKIIKEPPLLMICKTISMGRDKTVPIESDFKIDITIYNIINMTL